MDLEKHGPVSERAKRDTFILKGECAAGSQCRHYALGAPAGFSACGKCIFHLGCTKGPEEMCTQCHVAVGTLDTTPFRQCFRRGCAAKAQGLCKNCSAALLHAVKKRTDMLGTMSSQALVDYVAQTPGYSDLPRAVVSICAALVRTALCTDWQYDVRPSGDILSFGKVVLEEHLRNPRPIQLSALVTAAGFGHVVTKAVTQLRREIASHPQTWTLKGDRVFLMKRHAVDESPRGMLDFLHKRSTEAVPAFVAIGLYGTAAADLCSLITDGQAEVLDNHIFVTWKSPLGHNAADASRLDRWLRRAKHRKKRSGARGGGH